MTSTALNDDFFSEFPSVSKADWLRQIAKDLKGKPLEELDWQVADGLKVSPFAHADDFGQLPSPLSSEPNRWEICEDIVVSDPVSANRQALDALEGGVEGLRFYFETAPGATVFEQIFDGVFPEMIGLHLAGPGLEQNPGAVLAYLERLAKAKSISTQHLHGSLAYDPAAKPGMVDWRYLVDLVRFAQDQFPGFKLVTVAIEPEDSPIDEARAGLQRGNGYLEKLTERGLSATEAAVAIQFSITVGKSYFLEIAKIRAFKLLWLNVLKAWGAPVEYPVVEACFRPEAYTGDLYGNMIRGTTMAMSAVLGGADRLTVLPYDAGRETASSYPQAFSRRIARNVQHLLKMESAFSEIPDPAAGSYYIEQLTQQLAEKAWMAFRER